MRKGHFSRCCQNAKQPVHNIDEEEEDHDESPECSEEEIPPTPSPLKRTKKTASKKKSEQAYSIESRTVNYDNIQFAGNYDIIESEDDVMALSIKST